MKIRFVQGNDFLVSWNIAARENVAMPFTPSHVEALSRDGKSYIGARLQGGISPAPIGYDTGTRKNELVLDLGENGDDAAFTYMESKIGSPYDWTAIIDFVLPINWHQYNHLICSAFMTLMLRKKMFFTSPLPVPAHMMSPRDVLLAIGSKIAIPGI
jgi:hypothetical protein